ncbi:MAG: DUF1254 domain-containing protein [Chroococcidiopsidaceae cyanobacterium CP_BM_RX_35]|nr:DUF1254 domain-containing protein [Chroococcidiopsidaceae cyanobacterium CP_BM_RX_35]
MSKFSGFSRRRFLLTSSLITLGVSVGAKVKGNSVPVNWSQRALDIGKQAYIWGYPLVVIKRTERIAISRTPLNQFSRADYLATPEQRTVVAPNNDTLYATAWLDLHQEPLILQVPDTNGRYYTIQFLDAYTNTFAYVGTRVTGTQEGSYAIVGPTWKGTLPEGVKQIESPTNTVWLLGRTLVDGEADLPKARALQQQYTLTLLSAYGTTSPDTAQLGPTQATENLPSPQDIASSGFQFYDELGGDLQGDPPPVAQRPLLKQFAQFGIGSKRGTLQLKDLTIVAALTEAVSDGDRLIQDSRFGTTMNGWSVNYLTGDFDSNYLLRAFVAKYLLGANVAEEALWKRNRLC